MDDGRKREIGTGFVERINSLRAYVMGVAMLLVMLFHWPFPSGGFLAPLRLGYWGVDVFLFLSGVGIAFSLKRASGEKLGYLGFYGRRLHRIMPAALLAGWIFYATGCSRDVLCLFGMNLWYIRAIMFMYLLAPVFFAVLNKARSIFPLIVLSCCCEAVAAALIASHSDNIWAGTWVLQRTPVFLLGMLFFFSDRPCMSCFGRLFRSRKWMLAWVVVFCLLGLAARYVRNTCVAGDAARYVELMEFAFIALAVPFTAWLLASLGNVIPPVVRRCVEWMGRYSLELYLVHEFLFDEIRAAKHLLPSFSGRFVVAVLVSAVAAWGLKLGVALVERGGCALFSRLCLFIRPQKD